MGKVIDSAGKEYNYTSDMIDGFWDVFDLECVFPDEVDGIDRTIYYIPNYRDSNGNYAEFNKIIESSLGIFGDWKIYFTLNGSKSPMYVAFTKLAMFEMVREYVALKIRCNNEKFINDIDRQCCEKDDMLPYRGTILLLKEGQYKGKLVFCKYCGQLWTEDKINGHGSRVFPTMPGIIKA